MQELETTLAIEDMLGAENGNVAELMSRDDLASLATHLKSGIDYDINSRTEWERGIERWIELAAQVYDTKNTPWPNAANVKYPLLTIASMQFAARSYSALLPGTQWVNTKVVGKDDDGQKRERAIRISKHMSFQLTEEMEEWEEEHDRMLHVLPMVGTAYKKVYFDEDLLRNISEYVPAQEFVVDYHAKNINIAERKTHLLSYYDHELESKIRSGFFVRPENELVKNSGYKRRVNADKTQGMQNDAARAVLHNVGECHTWLDLDGDGLAEPYIVHIHLDSCQLLRIAPNYQEVDVVRHPGTQEIILFKPREYFVPYIFIPDPNSGVYGLGFGHLLGPLNEALNTIINQLLDAGTMSNLGGGFISKRFALNGGAMKFKPQEWKVVNSIGSDIKDGIFPLPIREPSGVLFNLLGFLENSGMRLASAVDLLSGDIPGQNTKATVALASIEQGLKVFTSIHKRIHKAFKKELQLLFRLNSEYLSDDEYFNVLDDQEMQQVENIAASDYNLKDMNVIPYSDPNVSSEQMRLAKAQSLFDVLSLGNVNPREVTKRYLEATEQANIEALMQLPPAQPDPELVMAQQELAHKMHIENRRLEMDMISRDISNLREKSVAILNLAKAEGEEQGTQLALYQDTMDRIAAQEGRLLDLHKQIRQEELQRQQAAQQQQQP